MSDEEPAISIVLIAGIVAGIVFSFLWDLFPFLGDLLEEVTNKIGNLLACLILLSLFFLVCGPCVLCGTEYEDLGENCGPHYCSFLSS